MVGVEYQAFLLTYVIVLTTVWYYCTIVLSDKPGEWSSYQSSSLFNMAAISWIKTCSDITSIKLKIKLHWH